MRKHASIAVAAVAATLAIASCKDATLIDPNIASSTDSVGSINGGINTGTPAPTATPVSTNPTPTPTPTATPTPTPTADPNASVGAWAAATAELNTPAGLLAAIVGDGSLFVTGGITGAGSLTQRIEHGTIESNGNVASLTTASRPLAQTICSQGGVLAGGNLFNLGGFAGSQDNSSVAAVYGITPTDARNAGSSDAWPVAQALPAARQDFAYTAVGSKIYVVGGSATNGGEGQTSTYVGTVATDGSVSWDTGPALPIGRVLGAAAVANNTLYFTGGQDSFSTDSTRTRITYYIRLDSNGNPTGSWNTTTELPIVMSAHGLVSFNNHIYTVGGMTRSSSTTEPNPGVRTIYYARANADGTLTNWAASTELMPQARFYHGTAISPEGYIYVAGGYAGANPLPSIQFARINR